MKKRRDEPALVTIALTLIFLGAVLALAWLNAPRTEVPPAPITPPTTTLESVTTLYPPKPPATEATT